MSESAIVPVRNEMTLQETMTLGDTLAKSGFFSDTRSAAQAVVKILAGKELGFGPIASMTGIHIIQGKVAVGANLMGASVKSDPRYDYRVVALSDERAEVAFYEGGTEIGRSVFTMEDAKAAGLTGKDNWRKFPRNMLFSRAMSNGVRWYCPDAFGGSPTYTPEELGAETDGEGNVIEGQFHDTPKPTPAKGNGNGGNGHWIDAVTKDGAPIRNRFWQWTSVTKGLEDSQVYEALGVEHIHDFGGTMDEAKDKIEAWITAQSKIDDAVSEVYGDE